MLRNSSSKFPGNLKQNFDKSNKNVDEDGNDDSDSLNKRRCCCSNKVCWWEPPPECLPLDFCRDTSLHGLKYISQSQRHVSERIFWLLAFIIGMLAAAYLITDVWNKYQLNPVIVSFQPYETTIDQIPFPAVTLCNMNKVQKSKAEAYIYQAKNIDLKNASALSALQNLYFMDHVCSASKSFSKSFKFSSKVGAVDQDLLDLTKQVEGVLEGSVQNFLRESSQQCSDMIQLCLWKGEIRKCRDLFRPIETDFGKCCTFNMIPGTLLHRFTNDSRDDPRVVQQWTKWDYQEDWGLSQASPDLEFPRRQLKAGKASGLSIMLDPSLDEYFCTTSDSVGFRLAVHQPMDFPHVLDYGHAIQPNSETFVEIRTEINTASSNLHVIPVDKRLCYFNGEKTLHYYNYYTANNCVDECMANLTYTNCSCVRYFMPRKPGLRLCGPQNFECAEAVKKRAYQYGVKNICSDCLPLCTDIDYQIISSKTNIQSGYNIWVDDANISASWSDRNVSIVHLYFGQDSTYARVRKELYGQTDLIASTGGLLGLCLGFSGLSLMEVLYFITLRLWCRRRRKRHIVKLITGKFARLWRKVKEKSPNTIVDHDYEKGRNKNGGIKILQNSSDPVTNTRQNLMMSGTASKNNPDENSPYFIITQDLQHIGNNLQKLKMQPRAYQLFNDVSPYLQNKNSKENYWNLRD